MDITIRRGHLEDLAELQRLFVDTVHTVCAMNYNEEQIQAWTSSVEKIERWNDIVTKQFLLVAQDGEKIVGFCSLEKDNDVDLLYVHKDYQGQGIATQLYGCIEQEAIRREQTQLVADVSITAKPFFEKMGFKLVEKQAVKSQGVDLVNYKMTKELKKQ